MAQDENVPGGGLEEDAIRVAGDLNRFDRRQRFGIKHDDRIAAGETVAALGVDRDAVAAVDSGDRADEFDGVQVIHVGPPTGPRGAHDKQLAAVGVGKDVIEPPFAADFRGVDNFVRAFSRGLSGCRLDKQTRGRDRKAGRKCQSGSTHSESPLNVDATHGTKEFMANSTRANMAPGWRVFLAGV